MKYAKITTVTTHENTAFHPQVKRQCQNYSINQRSAFRTPTTLKEDTMKYAGQLQ